MSECEHDMQVVSNKFVNMLVFCKKCYWSPGDTIQSNGSNLEQRIAKLELDFKDLLAHVDGFAAEGVKLEEQNRKLSEQIAMLKLTDYDERLCDIENIQTETRLLALESAANSTQQNPAIDESKLSDGEFLCEFCKKIRVKIMPTHWCCQEFYNKYYGKLINPMPDQSQEKDKPTLIQAFEALKEFMRDNPDVIKVKPSAKTKTYWVNVYRDSDFSSGITMGWIFCSEEDVKNDTTSDYIKTISFTIDEAE